jgi:hypothetical protein
MKEKFEMIAKVLFIVGVVLILMGSSSCPCRRRNCDCCKSEEGYNKISKALRTNTATFAMPLQSANLASKILTNGTSLSVFYNVDVFNHDRVVTCRLTAKSSSFVGTTTGDCVSLGVAIPSGFRPTSPQSFLFKSVSLAGNNIGELVVRPDGRMVHDMYLMQVKTPAESKYEWDYSKLVQTIPGDQAYMTKAETKCELWK